MLAEADAISGWMQLLVQAGCLGVLVLVLYKGVPYLLTHMAAVTDKFAATIEKITKTHSETIIVIHDKCEEGHRELGEKVAEIADNFKTAVDKLYDGRIAEKQAQSHLNWMIEEEKRQKTVREANK